MDRDILEPLLKRIQNAAKDFEHELKANGTLIMISAAISDDHIVVVGLPYKQGEPISPETKIPNNVLATVDADLPVEDMLTDREKEDYRSKRGKK